MDIRKTELPREKRIKENNRNRQLATIIRNTNRWMEILFHESNGLLGNINWISKIMQDEIAANDLLPEGTFAELNQTTQKNIQTLKEIYDYMQIMNAVADSRLIQDDIVILNEGRLLSYVPKILELEVGFDELSFKTSRTFAQVFIFLMNKMLEVAQQAGLGKAQIAVAFKAQDSQTLHVCVSASKIFWHHELWGQQIGSPLTNIPSDPSQWARLMFYEILALVDGSMVNGCTQQRTPKMATDGRQKETSRQYLEFSIPFGLERE